MGVLTGINTKMRGSVGQYTFKRLNGQTVVSEKVDKKAVPVRTPAQMRQRMAWDNIIAIWRSFTGNMRPSFESKPRTRSDYNEFMSANIAGNRIYLTKGVALQGGAVVAPYQVTRGSMPSISVGFGNDQIPYSDIALGGITIGASTTLRTFTQAILENNPDWNNGDQLSIFVLRQSATNEGVPLVTTECKEITLDQNDDGTLLGDLVGANYLAVIDGKLGMGGTVNGGIAFVHSRKTVGKTRVSTQRIVCNNPIMSQYTSETAYENAVLSYGGFNQEYFLTPNNTTEVNAQP